MKKLLAFFVAALVASGAWGATNTVTLDQNYAPYSIPGSAGTYCWSYTYPGAVPTWSATCGSGGGIVRQTFNNAAALCPVGTPPTVIDQTGSMSQSRALTLCPASAYTAGQTLLVQDVSGTVTAANTIVVTAGAGDNINGGGTDTIGIPFCGTVYQSDGVHTFTRVSGCALPTGTLTDANLCSYTASSQTISCAAGALSSYLSLSGTSQAFTGGIAPTSVNLGTVSSGTTTMNCGTGPLQYLTNGGAFTLAAPAADGHCLLYILNNGSAGAITFSGFTTSSAPVGDALTTTNASKFTLSIWRINGIASYIVKAMQ